ncbi:MAG: hypothetical protein KKF44_09160 [Nanoarchaeota archaeon]|nr:hypothetical protein [Nanoarchaeota archaeon]
MKNKIFILLFTLLIMNSMFVLSQEINIEKKVTEIILFGDYLKVDISITSMFNEKKDVRVVEQISDAEPVEPLELFNTPSTQGFIAARAPQYVWEFELDPLEKKNIYYIVKPNSLGTYTVGATEIYIDSKVYYSDVMTVMVKCIANGKCATPENSLNCPEDCSSSIPDGLCSMELDGICDPDCTGKSDPDCKTEPVPNEGCRDGICGIDENFGNCPADCSSGAGDKYCDKEADTICDPDCNAENDIDCKAEKNDAYCGDNECNFDEDSGSCPNDCKAEEEPVINCESDDYCEQECNFDPDCESENHQTKKDNNIWLILILIIAVIVIAAGIFIFFRNKENGGNQNNISDGNNENMSQTYNSGLNQNQQTQDTYTDPNNSYNNQQDYR